MGDTAEQICPGAAQPTSHISAKTLRPEAHSPGRRIGDFYLDPAVKSSASNSLRAFSCPAIASCRRLT